MDRIGRDLRMLILETAKFLTPSTRGTTDWDLSQPVPLLHRDINISPAKPQALHSGGCIAAGAALRRCVFRACFGDN